MKDYSVGMQAQLEADNLVPILFVQVELDNRTDYFCSAGHDVEWNGQTWRGAGGLISLEPIQESNTLEAHGMQFVINGMNPAQTAAFLSDQVQGRTCTCWFGVIGDNGIEADPTIEFKGRLDAPTRRVSENSESVISIPVESRMVQWFKASGKRFTHAEHIRNYPGDNFFRTVAKLSQDQAIAFPRAEYFHK